MELLNHIYGIDQTAMKSPKVLVVGAGGIGWELLKTLCMTGIRDLYVIDLDTIDISNLNRQFLFTRDDVGKSKAEWAARALKERFPDVKIQPKVGNIKSEEFDSQFFKQFDLIFNALDNIEARKHVSRVWVSLKIPLVDGGSTGYIGTAVSILAQTTPCYECIEKPTPKQFPVWTIRSTPDKMIHCIVWAKLLLSALFGPKEEENFLDDIRKELAEVVSEKNAQKLSKLVFTKVFEKDIQSQIELRNRLNEGKEEELEEEEKKMLEGLVARTLQPIETQEYEEAEGKTEYLDSEGNRTDTEIWEINKYIQLFMTSVKMIIEKHADKIGNIEFDKDDEILLDFVIAASNLRAHNYRINLESGFKIKEMAGNIVPAVSSTNGIVAGLEAIESFKLLAKNYDDLRATSFSANGSERVITGTKLVDEINPNWKICSDVTPLVLLNIDENILTMKDLVKLAKKDLAISWPLIEWNNNLLYEEGEDLDDEDKEDIQERLPKLLKDLNTKDKSKIYIVDSIQDFKIYLEVHYSKKVAEDKEKYPNGYEIVQVSNGNQNPEEAKTPNADKSMDENTPEDTDDLELVQPGDLNQKIAKKRRSESLEKIDNPRKKSKLE